MLQSGRCDLPKLSPEKVDPSSNNGKSARLRDRLCQLIRKHDLDGELVKAYATDFCGTKTLREATREQIEAFVIQFRLEVEKELTGKESEPSELVYFKVYKSQIPIIEQAIETAALMLGSDKSRGYSPRWLEMPKLWLAQEP